jgi:hypothetical protein
MPGFMDFTCAYMRKPDPWNQANEFAGRLLVPVERLQSELGKVFMSSYKRKVC